MNDFLATYWPLLVGGGGAIGTVSWILRTGRRTVLMLQRLYDLLAPSVDSTGKLLPSVTDMVRDLHAWHTESRVRLTDHDSALSAHDERLRRLESADREAHDRRAG